MLEHLSQTRTAKAKYYLRQLAKHFGHKLPVDYEDEFARIHFSIGLCELRADDNQLTIRCESPDATQLGELVEVMDSHFKRFAYKEIG